MANGDGRSGPTRLTEEQLHAVVGGSSAVPGYSAPPDFSQGGQNSQDAIASIMAEYGSANADHRDAAMNERQAQMDAALAQRDAMDAASPQNVPGQGQTDQLPAQSVAMIGGSISGMGIGSVAGSGKTGHDGSAGSDKAPRGVSGKGG